MLIEEIVPPRTQRSFANDWGQLDYLCKKIRYWLYKKRRRDKARRFIDRLDQVLRKLPKDSGSILQEEGLSLLFELKGHIGKAIAHRRQEVKLMRQLHKEARSAQYSDRTVAYMLRDRKITDLEERLDILAALEQEDR